MCGGGSNSAQKQAQQQEAQQQAEIQKGIAAVNSLYADPNRQKQYSDLAKNTTDYYTNQLSNAQGTGSFDEAQRKLKFAVARSGLGGGSAQADQSLKLGTDYQNALVSAAQKGQSAAAALQGQDEQTKQSIIAMIEGGLDATTAQSEAASALKANLSGNAADATAGSLGDLFSNVGDIYNRSLDQKAARQGSLYGYNALFSNPLYGPSQAGGG
jgi:hypothetical protein